MVIINQKIKIKKILIIKKILLALHESITKFFQSEKGKENSLKFEDLYQIFNNVWKEKLVKFIILKIHFKFLF